MPISEAELLFISKVKFKPKNKISKIIMPDGVDLMDVEELVPYENNVKIHTHKQIAKICTSIDKSGRWTQPIVVDGNNVIIAGHGRRLAAMSYGLSRVPFIKLDGISEEDANLLRLADNKVAEGEIDTNMLEDEIRILSDFGIDMIGIFEERELDFLIEDLGEIDFGQITDDLSMDVERQTEENAISSKESDDRTHRLSEVFENRPLTPFEMRTLSQYMAFIEDEQGIKGMNALIEHAMDYIDEKSEQEND